MITTSAAPAAATATTATTATTSAQQIGAYVANLSAKRSTPGGGSAAAVGAAVGAAAASMAASYTTRKRDIESGAAVAAESLISYLDPLSLLKVSDDDAAAYEDLRRTWKKSGGGQGGAVMSSEERERIEARALEVPTSLLEGCHGRIVRVRDFLPICNPGIKSDAEVGIHQLAGAARSAYRTVMVNSPPESEVERLKGLLREIRKIEEEILDLGE